MQRLILLVGGADTGRGPIAAALLRRILARASLEWTVESAGVTGHDGDPAEPEARSTMRMLGLDIAEHRARSLTSELAAAAALLIAVDSGTAHVLDQLYPTAAGRITTLSRLADRQRDIPDLFRMQMGAWFSYAREMEEMLAAGLARLCLLLGEELPASSTLLADPPAPAAEPSRPAPAPVAEEPDTLAPPPAPAPPIPPDAETLANRSAALERCQRLLAVLGDTPDLIGWPQARARLEADMRLAALPLAPGDEAESYVAMLVGMLHMRTGAPTPRQLGLVAAAVERLHQPIDPPALTELTQRVPAWIAAPPD